MPSGLVRTQATTRDDAHAKASKIQLSDTHGKEKSNDGPALPSSSRQMGVSSPLPFDNSRTSVFDPLQIRLLSISSLTLSCLTGRASILFVFIGYVVHVRFGGSQNTIFTLRQQWAAVPCVAQALLPFFSCAAAAADGPPLTPASFSWLSTTFS